MQQYRNRRAGSEASTRRREPSPAQLDVIRRARADHERACAFREGQLERARSRGASAFVIAEAERELAAAQKRLREFEDELAAGWLPPDPNGPESLALAQAIQRRNLHEAEARGWDTTYWRRTLARTRRAHRRCLLLRVRRPSHAGRPARPGRPRRSAASSRASGADPPPPGAGSSHGRALRGARP